MARTPFKLKSSPAKGALIDFFNSLGDQLRRGTERRIDKKYEDAGPNVRKQMLKEGYARPNTKPSVDEQIEAADKRFGEGVQVKSTKTTSAPSAQEMINMAYKGTNNDWDKASKNAMDMYGTTLTELIGKRSSPAEKKSPSKKRGYKMNKNK